MKNKQEFIDALSIRQDAAGHWHIFGSVKGNIDNVEGNVGNVEGDVDNVEGDVGCVEGNVDKVYGDIGKVKGDVYGNIEDNVYDVGRLFIGRWCQGGSE